MAAFVPRKGRRGATHPVGTIVEVLFGTGLLGLAALAGLAFVHRPWPNALDVLGNGLLPADTASRWANDVAAIGSLSVLLVGVVVVFLVEVTRDWVRAVACAVAPIVAVLVVQEVAKPLVDRHIGTGGAPSYPSGTVTAVTALATAAVLVTPRLLRVFTAFVGLMVVVGTCAAVVVLRWHYPTDALGGVLVGAGAVLFLDGLVHLPRLVTSSAGRAQSDTPPLRRSYYRTVS